MPIGEDIKDVLSELGTSLTIYKWPGPTTIVERVDQEFYPTQSTEFIRMFYSSISLPFDTQLKSGDLVEIVGTYFICTGMSPSTFEDSVVDYTASLFRCNCVGRLERYDQREGWDSSYNKRRTWYTVENNLHALQYENRYGQRQYIEDDVIPVNIQGNLLFLDTHVSPEIGDRWYPDATDYERFFRVSAIDRLRLDNVSICVLEDDKRE